MKPSKQLLVGMAALLAFWIPSGASSALATATPRGPVSYRPASGTGTIPMFFEENVGQTDKSVRFVGRGRDYSVLVTDSEAVFKVAPSGPDERSADVRMSWVGARDRSASLQNFRFPGRAITSLAMTRRPGSGDPPLQRCDTKTSIRAWIWNSMAREISSSTTSSSGRAPIRAASDSGFRERTRLGSMTTPATSSCRWPEGSCATRKRSSIRRRPPESDASSPAIPSHRTAKSPSRLATTTPRRCSSSTRS